MESMPHLHVGMQLQQMVRCRTQQMAVFLLGITFERLLLIGMEIVTEFWKMGLLLAEVWNHNKPM